jgi:hypothetical protein
MFPMQTGATKPRYFATGTSMARPQSTPSFGQPIASASHNPTFTHISSTRTHNMATIRIPNRYWQHICNVAAAAGVDPHVLLEHAGWLTAERALDLLVAQDEGNMDVDISDDLAEYLAELGPLAFLFGHANLTRIANLLGKRTADTPAVAGRDEDGKFCNQKLYPTTGPESLPGNAIRALTRVE